MSWSLRWSVQLLSDGRKVMNRASNINTDRVGKVGQTHIFIGTHKNRAGGMRQKKVRFATPQVRKQWESQNC